MPMPRRQSSIKAEANIKANIAGKSVQAPRFLVPDATKGRGTKRAASAATTAAITTTGNTTTRAKRAKKLPTIIDENALKEQDETGVEKRASKPGQARKRAGKAPQTKAEAREDKKEELHPTQMPLSGGSFAFGKFNTSNPAGPGPTLAADLPAVMTRGSQSGDGSGIIAPLGPLNTNMSQLHPAFRALGGPHPQLMQTPYNHPAPAMSPLRQQAFPLPSTGCQRSSLGQPSNAVAPMSKGPRPSSQAASQTIPVQQMPTASLVAENRQLARRLAIAEGEVERLRATPPKKLGNERIIDQPAAQSYVAVFGIVFNYLFTHGITGAREFNIKGEIKRFQDTEAFFLNQKRSLEAGVQAAWTIDFAGMTKPINVQNHDATPGPGGAQQYDNIGIKHGFELSRINLFRDIRQMEAAFGMTSAFDRCNMAFIRLVASQVGYHRLAAWAADPARAQTPPSLITNRTSMSSGTQLVTPQSHHTQGRGNPFIVPSNVQSAETRAASGPKQPATFPKPYAVARNVFASPITTSEDSMPQRSYSAPVTRMTLDAAAEADVAFDHISHRRVDTDVQREICASLGTQQTLALEGNSASDDAGARNVHDDHSSSSSSSDGDDHDDFHTAAYNMPSGNDGVAELLASMADQSEFGSLAEAYDHRASLEGYVAVHDFDTTK